MMFVVLTAALAALVSLAVGLPWGLVLRRATDDVVDLVTDSVLVGLVLVVSGLTMYTWIGVVGLGLSIVVELALVAVLIARRRQLRWPSVPVRREWVFVGAVVVVLIIALVLRRHTIDFITYTGDMGAYVNWANQFLRTGGLHASWPPFYPMFLVFGGLLTGAKGVTAIIAITGLLLILATIRVLRIVGVNPWMALLAGIVVAVHPEAIWYSQIPLSESLNAPMIVLWLLSIAVVFTSKRVGLFGWAFVSGVTMLALSLLRGTAPILVAPLVLVAIIALIAPRWRPMAPRLWLLVAANGVGSAIGFWYGVDRIPGYYVTTQVKALLPNGLYTRLLDVGVLKVGVVSAVVLVVVVIVLAAIFALVRRLAPRDDSTFHAEDGRLDVAAAGQPLTVGIGVRIVEVVLAIAMLVAVHESQAQGSEVWNILHREGMLLVYAAIAAPVLLALTRHGRAEAALAIISSVVVTVFVQLQTGRLAGTRVHTTFLYWDRYLYSEFFPAMILLVGIVFGIIYRLFVVRFDPATVLGRAGLSNGRQVVLTGFAVAFVALVLVKAVLPVSSYIQKNELLLGAGTIETKLQTTMSDTKTPFVWGGSSASSSVAGSGFPNTWMAFGTPLSVSYGREFANSQHTQPKGDFSPDLVLTANDLTTAMACTKSDSLYVVENETTGTALGGRIAGGDLTVKRLATIKQDVVELTQVPVMDHWHVASYDLEVFKVTASSVPAASGTCDPVPGP